MMTTLWPLISLVLVAVAALLLSTIVRGLLRGDEEPPAAAAAGPLDEPSLPAAPLPAVLIAGAWPAVLLLLFLLASVADQLGRRALWFLLLLLLPPALGTAYARWRCRLVDSGERERGQLADDRSTAG